MNKAKISVFAAAMLTAFGVFADAANVLISFSTQGPDKYADDATVLDGERYALVWSADGKFEGINTDCTPVDSDDLVIFVAPLAKGGCCPLTLFQIDSQSPNAKRSGVYAVYLLDTRTADKQAVSATDGTKPELVNGVVATEQFKAANAMASVQKIEASGTTPKWFETAIAGGDGATQPSITKFDIVGTKAVIEVSNMLPGVKYNIRMGEEVNQLDNYAIEAPKSGVESATFTIEKGNAKFFQVAREPLTLKK